MTKTKKEPATVVGMTVAYLLTPADAVSLNAQRNPERAALTAGEKVAMTIEDDHGGDNVSGTLKADGATLYVSRCNRGPSLGQWDFRTKVVYEDPTQ